MGIYVDAYLTFYLRILNPAHAYVPDCG
jgi:hypothetical protein